ncbi:unnamed protein product [Ectocarpus sp. 6 AP-2014]
MASHQHSHCGDSTCNHDHGTSGQADGEEDFHEFLEETHPCCQKDSEAKARALKLRSALDKVDLSQIAERARKAAFSSGLAGPPASRGGVGDYPALREARAAAAAAAAKDSRNDGAARGAGYGDGIVEGHNNNSRVDSDDDDDDDDDDLDYLLDDPEITRMAQIRVEAMHADATRLQNLRALGFGLHIEVPESGVEEASRGQFRGAGVVLHLYDADSELGASLDLLLEAKAGSYMGTRFVRCRLRPESAVAATMRIRRVPALACYKGGVRMAYTEQLSQFGNSDGVDPGAVERWLVASGTLEFDPPDADALCEGGGLGMVGDDGDGDDEESAEARYDCGLDGCHKTFKHDHFLAAGGGGLPKGFGEGV